LSHQPSSARQNALESLVTAFRQALPYSLVIKVIKHLSICHKAVVYRKMEFSFILRAAQNKLHRNAGPSNTSTSPIRQWFLGNWNNSCSMVHSACCAEQAAQECGVIQHLNISHKAMVSRKLGEFLFTGTLCVLRRTSCTGMRGQRIWQRRRQCWSASQPRARTTAATSWGSSGPSRPSCATSSMPDRSPTSSMACANPSTSQAARRVSLSRESVEKGPTLILERFLTLPRPYKNPNEP